METYRCDSIEDVIAAVGETLFTTSWEVVDQSMIDAFADATGDRQFIHVDPDRCAAEGGLLGAKTTVAHGKLTSSMAVGHMAQRVSVKGHYFMNGADETRYSAMVPVGAEIRFDCVLVSCERLKKGAEMKVVSHCMARTEKKPNPKVAATVTITVTIRPAR